MSPVRRAVIDVGTNSVKLLVADVTGRQVWPVWEGGTQTRLGEGFYTTRRLQPRPLARTAAAVRRYARQAGALGAATVRAFATSAAREAINRRELVAAIAQTSGLRLEILSGRQEALWTFRGAQTHPQLAAEPLLLVEVGGGSTQCIFGQGDAIHFFNSYPLGVVRLLERFPHSDPPQAAELAALRAWLATYLAQRVVPDLAPALARAARRHARHHAARLVGAGGTATVLARMEQQMTDYDRERIEAVRLRRARLRAWTERLWALCLAARKQIVGLPPERADVMLAGAAIYEAILEQLGFDVLRVSTRGLRFAAVLELQDAACLKTRSAVGQTRPTKPA